MKCGRPAKRLSDATIPWGWIAHTEEEEEEEQQMEEEEEQTAADEELVDMADSDSDC